MLRRLASFAFVVPFLLLLEAPPAAGGCASQANAALARRIFDELLNQGRYELFDQIYRPDFVKHVDLRSSNLAEEVVDAKSMRLAMPDLVLTIDQMVAEGDRVAVLYTGRGTHTGPLGSLPASGRKLQVVGMSIFRLAEGKIAEEWTSYNMLEILTQMGYYPPPAAR